MLKRLLPAEETLTTLTALAFSFGALFVFAAIIAVVYHIQ
jgi:hypothetical protein